MRTDNLADGLAEMRAILKEMRQLARATPLAAASVGRGRLRMYDNSELLIEDGNLRVTGTGTITGTLQVAGTLGVTGTTDLDGPVVIDGAATINGNTGLRGNMTVSGGGKITVGAISLLPSGGPFGGGSIVGGSGVYVSAPTLHATGNVFAAGKVISTARLESSSGAFISGDLTVTGAKNFRMNHPLKDGWWIQHGATESPVSGTEYWGVATLNAEGVAVVELPDYFEALNKPTNRTVMATPVGRPFPVGADLIEDGKFTIYGEPSREVSWLVKAERFGGDFAAELIEEAGGAELGAEAGDGDTDDGSVVSDA